MKTIVSVLFCLVVVLSSCKKSEVALRSASLLSDKAYPKTGDQILFTLQSDVVYNKKNIEPDKITWNIRDVRDNAMQPDRTDGKTMALTVAENGIYKIEVVAEYPENYVVRRSVEADVKPSLSYIQNNLSGTFTGMVTAYNGSSWPISITLYSNQSYASMYLTNSNLGPSNGNGKCFYFANDINIPGRVFSITSVGDDGIASGTIALQDTFSFEVKPYPISNFTLSNSARTMNFLVRDLGNSSHYVQCSLVKN